MNQVISTLLEKKPEDHKVQIIASMLQSKIPNETGILTFMCD